MNRRQITLTRPQLNMTVDWFWACIDDNECETLKLEDHTISGSTDDLYVLFERMSRITELCEEEGDGRGRLLASRVCDKLWEVCG